MKTKKKILDITFSHRNHEGAYIYVLTIILSAMVLTGCFFLHPLTGPGYTASISVLDNAKININDIRLLKDFVEKEYFNYRRTSSTANKWECLHYDRDLIEPKFENIKHYKFITIGWCYEFGQTTGEVPRNINNFYVNISNNWGGQDPLIKQEIERLASIIYMELVNRFGKGNVKIERHRTGPPF